ncbi:histone deacetylase [bacterium]|nr:histone deacetylase [bacterium]
MKILYHPKCLEYRWYGHPESPERLEICADRLKEAGYSFLEPVPCGKDDLLLAHSPDLIRAVKENTFQDYDTPNIPYMYDYAILSAGSAREAAVIALNGEHALSLMRPPGHHAKFNRVAGFCYFNNIAIATKKALDTAEKVAILDIDVHHGDGTQSIFKGDYRVLYISLHQSPLYPGTGTSSEDNCLNFPLPPLTGNEQYISVLEGALELIAQFKPSILGVSLGLDTLSEDHLAFISLTPPIFSIIGKMIEELGIKTFTIFEGGYSKDNGVAMVNYVKGLESPA